ncbi:MAG: TonB family protein [Gammaproteobacteria bacterium]|nr:TonB family protein [Gammaproteobacteria bacterium]
MTGIAAAVGRSVSVAAGSMAGGADDMLSSFGDPTPAWKKPKTMAIGGGAVLAIAIVSWLVTGGDSVPDEPASETTAASSPAESRPAPRPATAAESRTAAVPGSTGAARVPYAVQLQRARDARDAGNLITPAGSSAVELYATIAADAAGDPDFDAEFGAVINAAFGIAESAILAGNADQADRALDMVRFADPGNPRLNFLRVQVNEMLLRDRAEAARAAIRDGRFEDAGKLISEARSFASAESTEIDLLTAELTTARSEQQVGATIVSAKQRLEAGRLLSPANDNARYFFELALANDPGNLAAQQGLIAVASKLVLQARDAIDGGNLDHADRLLDAAAELDPSSAELAAVVAALGNERETIAKATRNAEAARNAELARQAAAAEQAKQNSEVQANRVATASPLGVGASAPKQTAAVSAPPPAANRQTAVPEKRAEPEIQPPVRDERTQLAATTAPKREPAAPIQIQSEVQTQSARAVNLQGGAPVSVTGPALPEMVPISRLTRVNYVGPEYPRAAQRRNITGAVNLGFTVTTDGRVRDIQVLSAEPSETFDRAAMEAVEQWRFEPVIENGVAVEKRSVVRLAFDIN